MAVGSAPMSLSQMLAQASKQQGVSAQTPVGQLMSSSIMQSEALQPQNQEAVKQNRLPAFTPETMKQTVNLNEIAGRLERIGHVKLASELRGNIDKAVSGNSLPAWQPVTPRGLLAAFQSGQIPKSAIISTVLYSIQNNPIFKNEATLDLLDNIRVPAGFAAGAADQAFGKRHTTFADNSISMRSDLNAGAYQKNEHGQYVNNNGQPLGVDFMGRVRPLNSSERSQRVRVPDCGITCDAEMKGRMNRSVKILSAFQQNTGFRIMDFDNNIFDSTRSSNSEAEATQFVNNLQPTHGSTPFPEMFEKMIMSGDLKPGREMLTIITDGEPTSRNSRYAGPEGMKLVGDLAKKYEINVTIALCTNNDDVVDFYNNNVDDNNDFLAVTDQFLDELTDTIKSQGLVFREAYTEGANDLDTLYGGAVGVADGKDEKKFSIEETGQYLGYIPDNRQYVNSIVQVASYQSDEDQIHGKDEMHQTVLNIDNRQGSIGAQLKKYGFDDKGGPSSLAPPPPYNGYEQQAASRNPLSRSGSIGKRFFGNGG